MSHLSKDEASEKRNFPPSLSTTIRMYNYHETKELGFAREDSSSPLGLCGMIFFVLPPMILLTFLGQTQGID